MAVVNSKTSIEKVNESEQPSGAQLVASRDLYVDAVDANGRPLRHGQTLVALAGRRIPSAYAEHPDVAPYAVKASEYEPAKTDEATSAAIVEPEPEPEPEPDADADGKGDDDGADVPISRMTKPQLESALDAEGVDVPDGAKVDDLRELLRDARGE